MKYKTLFWTLLFALPSCQNTQKAVDAPTTQSTEASTTESTLTPNLYGAWKSESSIGFKDYNYNFEYRFTKNRWELVTTIASDKEFKKILLVFREEGTFVTNKESDQNVKIDFKTIKKFVKAVKRDPRIISELGLSRCLNQFKVEMDISGLNCGKFKAVSECPHQFDLLVVQKQKIQMGERTLFDRKCSEKDRPSDAKLGFRKLI